MDALTYISHFKHTPAWKTMQATVEDSPWHREANVAVHTEMCIDQYVTRFMSLRNERQNKIALLALLFHDTGKPAAEETLEKKDGSGTYRRYAGHEQDSAVTFTEHWLTDPALRDLLTVDEARQVRWIIEHHLPYGLKDGKKRSDLRTAIDHTLREDVDTFYDCLRSDAAGRISDDHETKLKNAEDWIHEFRTVPLTINRYDSSRGRCYVLIGPSGSGKTTWMKQYGSMEDCVFSLDRLRLSFYGDSDPVDAKTEYREAWEYCASHEKEFKAFMEQDIDHLFNVMLKPNKSRSVFIDNTNGSKKTRARYIQAARALGMKVVAVEFWNTFDVLAARQQTRPDKEVPTSSLRQQYFAQTCAWKGSEVDEIIVVYQGA